MREMPHEMLDPKITNVWRINDANWIVVCFLACFVPFVIVASSEDGSWAMVVMAVIAALFAVFAIIFLVVLPPIRYARWRYEMSSDFLDIARGIIWRKRFVIPFIRVQNTDTRQGPIMRAFGLSSVTVATAAGEHEIPGISTAQAEQLRDRAAELARIAREDI